LTGYSQSSSSCYPVKKGVRKSGFATRLDASAGSRIHILNATPGSVGPELGSKPFPVGAVRRFTCAPVMDGCDGKGRPLILLVSSELEK